MFILILLILDISLLKLTEFQKNDYANIILIVKNILIDQNENFTKNFLEAFLRTSFIPFVNIK